MAGEWHRLFTPMFLHAGVFHLLLNSVALCNIGGVVKGWYGPWRFWLIYLSAGVTGKLFSFSERRRQGAAVSDCSVDQGKRRCWWSR
mmetsp:Transcript_3105/g.7810  ORF Transcript_3105/g.7810 Transcript_3105/m.7810 type:complete len:87 (+) Transcript_3105:704-964(+)